jgi:tetratricopeptide (TPR) repeat protein
MPSVDKSLLRNGRVVRKLSTYLFFYCLVPVAFFVLLEVVLRTANYGYPAEFFVKEKIDGKEFYVNNYKFSWRFFPKSMARLSASVVVPVRKDKDSYRVFVFGESAAMGDPDPAFSFSRMLQAMLEKKHPDRKIEIYNTAVTAINSHVILPIAKECLKLEPDLFIIYAGNNEVIGPYGLSAALSPFLSQRFFIKAKIWLDQTRTGQWITSFSANEETNRSEWRGMEMFMKNSVRFDHPNLEKIYSHFQMNLTEICNEATEAGVKVVLSTVVTNISDCAPFLSLHSPSIDQASLKEWQQYFDSAVSLADSGLIEKAIEEYQQAFAIDSEYAELNYRLGQCYRRVGKSDQAIELLTRAQDFDALRFRADSRLNDIVKHVAYSFLDKGVFFADSKIFAAQNGASALTGNDLMYEHVHLNPKGNFVLANCILQQVENSLELPSSMEVVGLESCLTRLAYTSFDEMRIAEINVSRMKSPPFTNQYLNKTEVVSMETSLRSLQQELDSVFEMKADRIYSNAVTRYPNDWYLHLNYLRFTHYFNNNSQSLMEAKQLYSLLPFEYLSSVNMGIAHMQLQRYDEAKLFFDRAILINPYFSEAYKNMSVLYEQQGSFYRAGDYLKKSKASDQAQSIFYNRAGVLLAEAKNMDSAIYYFSRAISLDAHFAEPRLNLKRAIDLKNHVLIAPQAPEHSVEYNKANVYFREGNYPEAIKFYQKALRITPSFSNAHNNMGICFIQLNQFEEARNQFTEAIKIDPGFFDAYPNLANVLNELGQYQDAVVILNKGLLVKKDPDLYHLLAEVYLKLGDEISATRCIEQENQIRSLGSSQ